MLKIAARYEVDTYTIDEAEYSATRKSILQAGGKIISSAPVEGGYIISAAYRR